jgi:hypothetical protein
MFTLQETFNMICEGFAKQNWEPASIIEPNCGYVKDTKCAYRLPNGYKCAVGQLISDEEYLGTFEDEPILNVIQCCPSLQKHSPSFLSFMQLIHDETARFNKNLKDEMRMVATNKNLEWKF